MSTISGTLNTEVGLRYKLNISRPKTIHSMIRQNHDASRPYALEDCPIAALEFEGFSPNKIINITSFEDSIYENTIDFHVIETLSKSGNYFKSDHYAYSDVSSGKIHYLITDIKAGEAENGSPLFYQYELLYDVYALGADVIKNIYKNNEIKISPSQYKVQYSYDYLDDGNTRYSSTTWRDMSISSNGEGVSKHRVRVLFPIDFFDESSFYVLEYDKSIYSAKSYQRELIELRAIYDNGDYKITDSGIAITVGSKLKANSQSLDIIKDPGYIIRPMDILAIKPQSGPQSFLPDRTASWNLRLNLGSFQIGSGYYSSRSANFYNLEDHYTDNMVPISRVAPTLIGSNILRVKEAPIYVNETKYSHPLYQIETYDVGDSLSIVESGKIGITVNGRKRTDITIKSIDRQKGYLQLDKSLEPTDEIELAFYVHNSGYLLVDNLELNPSIDNVVEFHVSGYFNTGFGIALIPWDAGSTSGWYPYIYDPTEAESSRTATTIPPIGGTTSTLNWADHDFFKICEVSINKITPDMVKVTDARVYGGGIANSRKIDEWFDDTYSGEIEYHEREWYTDKGYYDGYPLPHNSMIVIHVPETIISGMEQQWIDHYTTQAALLEETDPGITDDYIRMGQNEFKFYLDQTIRRYISAGTDYILVPTVSGDFGANNIMDLT